MQKQPLAREIVAGLALSLFLLVIAVAVHHKAPHLHLHNPRLQYGAQHLAAALFASALFTAAVVLARRLFGSTQQQRLESASTPLFVLFLIAVFSAFWLPVLLAGGFVHDDWLLLAAASIRHTLVLHPLQSWFALDTVDGNFRPIGTALYYAFALKLFGLHGPLFLIANFVVNLAATLTLFAIVRELGYPRTTATVATLLYLSRGILYTDIAWTAALGDGIVLLLGGLTALALLRATHLSSGPLRLALHGLAWLSFLLATLAKQSAFAIPLIAALIVFMRPGTAPTAPLSATRRLRATSIIFVLYAATAAVVFRHARALLGSHTPYPLHLTPQGLIQPFSYFLWYLVTLTLPDTFHRLNALIPVLGLLLSAAVIAAIVRHLRRPVAADSPLAPRPSDVVFALLAAVASVAMFVLLGNRVAAYYGAMAAFWVSIALGIVLGRLFTGSPARARLAGLILCLLLITGFIDVRLKQTGLFPSGGYIWGTYGMDQEGAQLRRIQTLLSAPSAVGKTTLVLIDFPENPDNYTSMALILDPALTRLYAYSAPNASPDGSPAHAWYVNDRNGGRPQDTVPALSDVLAYHWSMPLASAPALPPPDALYLNFNDGDIRTTEPPVSR